MKAARIPQFGAPDVFRIDDIPQPQPKAGEALIRIKACGVNRMDTELRAGVYGGQPLGDFFFGKDIVLPHLPGVEPAGSIETIELASSKLVSGTRVVPHSHLSCGSCFQCRAGYDNACAEIRVLGVQTPGCGGYAEYFTWPAAGLIPFDEALSFEQAAALLVNYGPVWFGLHERAKLKVGETVVITGAAGGCGHAALDIVRLLGARAIAVTRSPDKTSALREAGADAVVIDRAGENWAEEVAELTSGEGANCVLELVGAATWSRSLEVAASRGRVVVIGSHSGLNVDLNLGQLFGKNLSIEGITRANRSAMEALVQLAGQGKLRPHVGHTLPLDNVAEAHRMMDADEHIGKIVLTMS
jgi:acryloyl-coenzyme A reductase